VQAHPTPVIPILGGWTGWCDRCEQELDTCKCLPLRDEETQ
jgi:hypothetical protein